MTLPPDLDALASARMLHIVPWPDPVVEAFGFGLRDPFVEQVLAAHVGPTSVLLLRRVGLGFALDPEGFALDVAEAAAALGIGAAVGRNGAWWRTLGRLTRFGYARVGGVDTLAVRRAVAPLSQRHVHRLPPTLQRAHALFVARLAATASARSAS